ncbi:MAG TPA: hypothetical protein VLE72_02240 [Candidatus Saccharimonadales bacterium]|nr:hypothetical protein [Candidatus Saccharimonadales bacterium]
MSDVLYLENDEDITSAVEKLKASQAGDVSIVVPKRSTLLQSMINLKLLKKAADESKKELVLVTTDRLSSHLAGRVGLAVADKLGAEASVPEANVKEPDPTTEVIDGGTEETGRPETAAAMAGVAAGATAAKAAAAKDEAVPPATDTKKPDTSDDKPTMTKKPISDSPAESKKMARVPDFNAMQKRVFWGALALVIVFGLLFANFFLERANVTVFAKGSKVPAEATFTADPSAPSSNISAGTVKAQEVQSSKDLSEQVTATGKKDAGTKATGTITITNNCYNPGTIAAGTVYTAADGHRFLGNSAIAVPDATISGGVCHPTTASVGVTAAENGDSYNLAPTSYTVGSIPSSGAFNVKFQGGQMGGGTTKTVTVVQQSDIDGAVADLLSKDKDGAQADLVKKVTDGYRMMNETMTQTPSNVSGIPAVGAEAANVTVKVTANYDALAISNDDLNALLDQNITKQIGPGNQIYDNGAASAQFQVIKKNTGGSQNIHVAAEASAGPKIDTAALAKQIKGKKLGDAMDIINKTPGVDHSEITLWPSWDTKLPRRASKIKIEIKVATTSG